MYPLYWTTSKEGTFMRYSYEFKRKCVELYRKGIWMETPEGISQKNFHITIRRWCQFEDAHGTEGLKHFNFNKVWTPEQKLELVAQVISGKSNQSVAIEAGVDSGLLYRWVRKYKTLGYNGLVDMKKGRPSKETIMKKTTKPLPLTESEREELIRLRAETEYLKAENAVIKKEIALREEKRAALLKAKKQQSSKNYVKKDIP